MGEAMSTSTIITAEDMRAAASPEAFARDAVERHMQSELYRNAVAANEYYRQRNVTINRFVQKIFSCTGAEAEDFTASRLRIASNLFKRLNVQRCMYSLGKGVSFVDCRDESGEDVTKEGLGPRFDDDVKAIGLYALIHGVSFGFWNLDHIDVFTADGFAPVWDEVSGALVAGVRFWRIDPQHAWNATLYEEDGYTHMAAQGAGSLDFAATGEKQAYKVTYRSVPADGLALAVDSENYSRLPIVPVWGSDAHQSTLVGMREGIDAYDLIKSGLANDVRDCAQVYWLVSGAAGMQPEELDEWRARLSLTHIATADDDQEVTPYTQDVPVASRRDVLAQLKADIYEDFGALDVHTVAAGATNDHIDAAYQPMDEEADEFERHIREGIMDLLELQGIVDTPVFTRNRISNVREQVETVALEAQWLDEETILRKLPNVTPDEVAKILEKRNAEDGERMAALPPELAANAAGSAGTDDDSGEGDDGDGEE